jgi:hypothetical protein
MRWRIWHDRLPRRGVDRLREYGRWEIGVVGICVSQSRGKTLYLTLMALVPALLLIAGAVSLWLQRGGGLYWVTAL